MMKAGDRIGAILKMDATTVHLIGYGTFVGNEIPDESLSGCIGEILREENIPNGKMIMDDGTIVWGCECWWGSEEQVKTKISDRIVIPVDMEKERA